MSSIWQPVIRVSFVWLLTPERCREGGCEWVYVCVGVCVWLLVAGGQPDNNKGPALSLSPMIFELSEKLLWYWKKVKLKSLAWYVLTTACCTCDTSKYFLSRHICSFWERQLSPSRVYGRWLSDRAWRSVSTDQVRAVSSGPVQVVDLCSSINSCDSSMCWCRKDDSDWLFRETQTNQMSQLSHPAVGDVPLVLPLPCSACRPRLPH